MRAVVIATKNGRAAVMTEGGGMRYIPDAGYQTGQILDVAEENKIVPFPKTGRAFFMRYGAGIAAAMAVMIVAGGVTAYAAPVTKVTLGTDSAIEYRVNVFDRVIGFSAPDGGTEEEMRAFGKKLRGKKLEDAIDFTIREMGDDLPDGFGDEEMPVRVESPFGSKRKKLRDRAENRLHDIRNLMGQDGSMQASPEEKPVYEVDNKGEFTPEGAGDVFPDDNGEETPEISGYQKPGNESGRDSGAVDDRPDGEQGNSPENDPLPQPDMQQDGGQGGNPGRDSQPQPGGQQGSEPGLNQQPQPGGQQDDNPPPQPDMQQGDNPPPQPDMQQDGGQGGNPDRDQQPQPGGQQDDNPPPQPGRTPPPES